MKTNKTTTTDTIVTTVTTNPFQELSAAVSTDTNSRKLPWTTGLTALSMERATTLMTGLKPEDVELANTIIAGNVQSTVDLLSRYFSVADDAAQVLTGADETSLKKMLESQRSVRSTSKKKGLTNTVNCRQFISATYAELLIRDRLGKPFTGATGTQASEVDTSDLEAVTRKVKSLQSKKCRLGKLLAAGDESVRADYEATVSEIERLNGFKPTTTKSTVKTVVKSMNVDQLRSLLASVDKESLSEADTAAYESLMAKLAQG